MTDLLLLSTQSLLFHPFVRRKQRWIFAKWKQISSFSNQSFKWTLKWVGVLITVPVIFSLMCKYHGRDPSAELPLRGAGEGCADGKNCLIEESEEIWGDLLICFICTTKLDKEPTVSWTQGARREEFLHLKTTQYQMVLVQQEMQS